MFKRLASLSSYSIASQVIILLNSLYLLTLLNVESFGLYGIYVALWAIFTPIFTGTFELKILTESDKKVKKLTNFVASYILISFFIFLSFSLLIFNQTGNIIFIFTSIGVFITAISSVFKMHDMRRKIMINFARGMLINSIIFCIASNYLVIQGFNEKYILIVSHIIGQLSIFVFYIFAIKIYHSFIVLSEAIKLFFKHKENLLFVLPSTLTGQVTQTYTLGINFIFGLELGGIYTIIQRIIIAPFIAIGTWITDGIRNKVAENIRNHADNANIVSNFIKWLTISGILLLIIYQITIPPVLGLFIDSIIISK